MRPLGSLPLLLLVACATATPKPQTPPQTEVAPATALIRFDTEASIARLARSQHKVDFFRLTNHFESQITKGHCGVASSVIVLNTLRVGNAAIDRPRDVSSVPAEIMKALPARYDPIFKRYTQRVFFDDKAETVKTQAEFFGRPKTPDGKRDPGFQIRQLHDILVGYGLDSKLHIVGDDADAAQLKSMILTNLRTPDDYVLVNYHRPGLDQPGGGHISPIGAYDEGSDSFLILDVNATAQRWVWAPASMLIAAMRTKDTVENRGFLLISEGK